MSNGYQGAGFLPMAGAWMQNQGMGPFPGYTQAGFNPMQQMGWGASLQGAGQMAGMADNWANMFNKALGGSLGGGGRGNYAAYGGGGGGGGGNVDRDFYFNNPYLNQQVDAATGGLQRNFDRNVAPQLKLQSALAGGLGGTRRDLGMGLAASDLTQQMADMQGNMRGQAWQHGLSEYNKASIAARNAAASRAAAAASSGAARYAADLQHQRSLLGMIPNMMGMYQTGTMMPGDIMGQIGGMQQGLGTSRLGDMQNQWDYWSNLGQNKMDAFGNWMGVAQGSPMPTAQPAYGFGGGLSNMGSQLFNQWVGGL